MKRSYIFKREGLWYYRRKVPKHIISLEKRKEVWQSTGISVADDPKGVRAIKAAVIINAKVESYWQGIVDGRSEEAEKRYKATRTHARFLGYSYLEEKELAENATTAEILKRIDSLVRNKSFDDYLDNAALLGFESPPVLKLSDLFREFEKAEIESLSDLSPDQLRKWASPKKRAIFNLVEVIGDKPLHEITRHDALDFREWWQNKLRVEGLNIGTANKDIGHLNKMLKTLDRLKRLGLEPIFSDIRISGERVGQRTAFLPNFIQKNLLVENALTGLNEEARRVLYLICETGLRLSEACNLTKETIHLDGEIPYISVQPDGRRMKTSQSARDIPLVGVALKAMLLQPNGFPRYRDRSSSLSALINKYLDNKKLRPTKNHSLYSLRHTFEDRLTAIEAPEKLIAAMMGHKYARPKYGLGPSLEQKKEWLDKISFKPPPEV